MHASEIQAAIAHMIAHDLRGRGLADERVLTAMASVPRHLFVPAATINEAYADGALPTSSNQTISQPFMVALMTTLLDVPPGNNVLEIGTGSGYQTAVLARLGARVVTVEHLPGLSDFAQRMLGDLGLDGDVNFVVSDGTLGYAPRAPYDRILVTAGAPHIPRALKEQLAPGGRIVVPVGDLEAQRLVVAWRDEAGRWREQPDIGCRFVPLLGADGWK
jgi:protein-L-isoaspartate(D-aspartate) O-methyltransferase